MRDTPSAKIAKELIACGFKHIIGYDPVAMEEFRKHYDLTMDYAASYDDILNRADAFAITTAWPEFKDVRKQTAKTVVDCRYML